MPQTKSNTKKRTPRKPSKDTIEALRAKLAKDLAAVLSNPECPAALYNDIVERIADFESVSIRKVDTAENIERALNDNASFEESRRKGGAR